jgi:hypothetical protein
MNEQHHPNITGTMYCKIPDSESRKLWDIYLQSCLEFRVKLSHFNHVALGHV